MTPAGLGAWRTGAGAGAPGPQRALFVKGVLGAGALTIFGLAVTTVLVLVGWITAPHTQGGLVAVLRTAAALWLVGNHVGVALRGTGTNGAWFGWPTDPEMEKLRDAWFEAPDVAAQAKIVEQMQARFWENPMYAPLGMYDMPTAFHAYLQDVPEGWPQFYGVKKVG